jgi:hypothetical protein
MEPHVIDLGPTAFAEADLFVFALEVDMCLTHRPTAVLAVLYRSVGALGEYASKLALS